MYIKQQQHSLKLKMYSINISALRLHHEYKTLCYKWQKILVGVMLIIHESIKYLS